MKSGIFTAGNPVIYKRAVCSNPSIYNKQFSLLEWFNRKRNSRINKEIFIKTFLQVCIVPQTGAVRGGGNDMSPPPLGDLRGGAPNEKLVGTFLIKLVQKREGGW